VRATFLLGVIVSSVFVLRLAKSYNHKSKMRKKRKKILAAKGGKKISRKLASGMEKGPASRLELWGTKTQFACGRRNQQKHI